MTKHLLKKLAIGIVGGVAIALAISVFYPTTASTSFYYAVTDLGDLDTTDVFNSSEAYDINNQGQVVGLSVASVIQDPSGGGRGFYHAFKWNGETMGDLNPNPLRSPSSRANGINSFGLVVGSFSSATRAIGNDFTHASLWRNNTMIDLGTLGGNDSQAHDINDAGQVVGESTTDSSGSYHAFKWENRTMTPLSSSPSVAYDINNKGQIVGYSYSNAYTYHHAVKWENGTMIDLGTLGGNYSTARAINNKGQVVGSSQFTTNSTGYHAFLWNNGTMTDLGSLGGTVIEATDINDAGVVVGYSHFFGPGYHGFVWRNGTMTDLNQLLPANSGWVIEYAYGINNKGQIVGAGRFNNSLYRAFLLTPVRVTN